MAGVKLQDEEIFQDYGSRGRKQTKMDAMVKIFLIFWFLKIAAFTLNTQTWPKAEYLSYYMCICPWENYVLFNTQQAR